MIHFFARRADSTTTTEGLPPCPPTYTRSPYSTAPNCSTTDSLHIRLFGQAYSRRHLPHSMAAGRAWPGLGGARGGVGKIAGVDVPWEYDADLKIDTKPSELFPVSRACQPRSARETRAPSERDMRPA